ncbi:MAG: endonuclease/exonuclease/phosphatase family protein [Promethearchaeia archaeon]
MANLSESKLNMRKKRTFFILSVAIMSFLFIESLSNFTLQVTAVIFWQFQKSTIIYGWIIFYLLLIFGIPLFFSLGWLSHLNKIKFLTLIIIIFRLLALYYISGELMLLFIIILFVSLLVYFTQILMLFKKVDFFHHLQSLITGVILGIGFYFTILSLNLSSNLSYAPLKIPFIIAFLLLLIFFAYDLFNPRALVNFQENSKSPEKPPKQEPLRFLHFVFLGLLTFLTVGWLINPVGLSAYDSSILEWIPYGFLFYIISILSSTILAFYLVQYTLKKFGAKLKTNVLLSNLLYLILNAGGILFIEDDASFFSTFYLIFMVIVSLYTLILDVSYLFTHYFFNSAKKTFIGQIVFMFSFGLSYIISIIFTYSLYATMLISISVLSGLLFLIFFIQEMKDLKLSIPNFNLEWSRTKEYGIFFICIFLMNLVSVSFILYSSAYDESTDKNPTIMVWNIHNGIGVDYKFDLDRIAEEIEERDPDILGLNEVDMGILKTGLIDIGTYLAEKLDMYLFYAPTYYNHYGIAILSKYPFENVENIALPRSPDVNGEPRAVIRAKVEINNKLWTIYVNHLSTKEEDRIEQVPFIVELIEEQEFKRVVWMGDFNAQPDETPYELVNSSGDLEFIDTHQYVDPVPKLTGGLNENGKPTNRIDYIFCSPDLVPSKTEVHCSEASDHCAVITKF